MVFIWVHCKASVDFFIKQLPKNHQNVLTSRTNWEVHHTPLKQWLGFCRKRVPLQIVGNSGLTLLGPSQPASWLIFCSFIGPPVICLNRLQPFCLIKKSQIVAAGCNRSSYIGQEFKRKLIPSRPISGFIRPETTQFQMTQSYKAF